jgi:hypothetical protein
MPDRFDLEFEVTRGDWLALHKAGVQESPEWVRARRKDRLLTRLQVMPVGVIVVTLPFLLYKRGAQPLGFNVVYLDVVYLVVVAAVMVYLYFAGPRLSKFVSEFEKNTKAQFKAFERVDLSTYTGTTKLTIDEFGVQVRSSYRELKLSWQAVERPTSVGGFILLSHITAYGTIIPPHAFASQASATEFLDCASRLWQNAQLPHVERLERYLTDRDLPCPKCKYNLRNMRGESCPECGKAIKLDVLTGT